MKKIALCLLLIFLVLFGNITIAEDNITVKDDNTTIKDENQEETIDINGGNFGIETWGPLNRIITKITLLSGPEEDLIKIQNILDNKTNQYTKPIQTVLVSNISFKVEYRFNIRLKKVKFRHPHRLIFKQYRFYYKTEISGADNFIRENVKHDVQVKDFTGRFILFRGKPFRSIPPRFVFDGTASTIITGDF